MIRIRYSNPLALIAVAALALVSCGKQEPAAPPANTAATPAPAAPTAPATPATPTPPPAPAASGTKLVSVDLTNNVDASGKVGGAPADTFAPNDKIYALVRTNNGGTNPSTVAAHWEYQGGIAVNDTTQPVMSTGESVTTFHIEKASGWPQGHYKVTISIDGQPAGTKEFEVK